MSRTTAQWSASPKKNFLSAGPGRWFTRHPGSRAGRSLELEDGSRVAVVGGGPAGSFFSYFFLQLAERAGVRVDLDIFERRDFSVPGPTGCNMCGGIVSESLVQALAAEGINLPSSVVERGIDSYLLHMDEGSVRIDTPLHEKRIAAVHRGAGPKGIREMKWGSFDAYLLELATGRGARHIKGAVDSLSFADGRPEVGTRNGARQSYDLLVVAAGVNSPTLKLVEQLPLRYTPPKSTRTYISEFFLGEETVERYLGNSMHVFLLHIPRLEFAAIVPKGDFVTLCLLGDEVDDALVRAFIDSPQVRACMPPGWQLPKEFCHCSPRISVRGALGPYGDRIVMIGDCGSTRLYKDGIGAAYRTAKAAATTAILEGVSAESFERYYRPVCRSIENDNRIGKVIFAFTRQIQKNPHDRRGVLRTVAREQRNGGRKKLHLSTILWDTFTGSAPYRDVVRRAMHPGFILQFVWDVVAGNFSFHPERLNGQPSRKEEEVPHPVA